MLPFLSTTVATVVSPASTGLWLRNRPMPVTLLYAEIVPSSLEGCKAALPAKSAVYVLSPVLMMV